MANSTTKIKVCKKLLHTYTGRRCNECRKAGNKAWRINNKEILKKNHKEWVENNREKRNAINAKWRANHKEQHRACATKWAKENPERVRDRRAARYAENTEIIKASVKAWRLANSKKIKIYNQNRRAIKLANGNRLSPGLSDKLFCLQQGKCACCKCLLDKYHLDHIMPLALGGLNNDNNIQLLCPTCNLKKHTKHPIDFMQSRGFLL